MHRGVRGIRDPRLLVDHGKPPARMSRAFEMIEPRHRAIVDIKGEALFGQPAERQADRDELTGLSWLPAAVGAAVYERLHTPMAPER